MSALTEAMQEYAQGCYRCDLSRDETSDYTPTTEEVREDYELGRNEVAGAGGHDQHRAEFNRWLATHDAEKRAEWEAEQGGHVVPCARCGQRRVVASDAINSDIEVCGRCGTEIGLYELAEQGETEWEYAVFGYPARALYRAATLAEARDSIASEQARHGASIIRAIKHRRKAGPWLPVHESDSGVRDSDSHESEGKA